jgi:hypothetical protein
MAHENLHRGDPVDGSSERVFGLTFAGLFFFIACWPLFHGEPLRWWALGVAAVFALIAMSYPVLLAEPNKLWTKLGVLLGRVVSPIALGVLFYVVFTPLGIAMRLSGKDSLRLKFDPGAETYWVERKPPGPPPDSMKNQF